ncbi:hypothetical protein [Dactylosporangium sp. CA-139066]|uniref:hypothetical protein n=1 Tax=Dactylosporangium sp. CA-139066 TaxID=3239930 RepID=UPI003D909181
MRQRTVTGEQLPDIGSGQPVEESLAACGQGHRLVAVLGAVDERRTDVVFEPVELKEQVRLVRRDSASGPDGQALPSGHIDLVVVDDSLLRRPAGLRRRWAALRVSASGVVVLVLIAGLIGAASGGAWAQWEQRRMESARVSLFIAVADLSSIEMSNGRVSIDGSVAVANGGPLPVEVPGPGGGDFLVWGQQRIAAATAARLPVNVRITCSAGVEQRPLPLALVVVTADGVRRAVEMKVDLAGRWQEMVAHDCQLPR